MGRKKLKTIPVSSDVLEKYIDEESSFSFEARINYLLMQNRFKTQFSGNYYDPSTKTPRQFDIRAELINDPFIFRAAIECKKLSQNFPLVVHATPREDHESYHDLLKISFDSPRRYFEVNNQKFPTPYQFNQMVGRGTDQVGVAHSDGSLVTGDGEVYPKISQSIQSVQDLIQNSNFDSDMKLVAIPVLVVPDETLWQISYERSGKQISRELVTNSSIYIGHKSDFVCDGGKGTRRAFSYNFTHLEICTESALLKLFETYCAAKSGGLFLDK